MLYDVALIGLGVMGQSLALNIRSREYEISVYNRSCDKTKEFMATKAEGKGLKDFYTLEELVNSLKKPRKIILMVNAGSPVDACIDQLLPLISEGDIIIDAGNSYFQDTIRRQKYLAEKSINYAGVGVSGGEEGALKGPSIMPGCTVKVWDEIKEILINISAKVDGDIPCCNYIGENGAGHFVKMVHNGIEYGDMQMICEAYDILRNALKLPVEEIQQIFAEWNKGELSSYLIEITADILSKYDDETGKPMVDIIVDSAGNKGTGRWTSEEALLLSSPASAITMSVFARYISAMKNERVLASKMFASPNFILKGDKDEIIEDIRKALYFSKIVSYAQGFDLLKRAAKEYKWDLNMGNISLLWRGGCIIRAQFLGKIKEAYDRNSNLQNLITDDYFKDIITKYQSSMRNIVKIATDTGVPVPTFTASLSYFDSYRSERLPSNLLQAQRDYFGAHTYERVDKTGFFHTEWI